VPHHLFTCSTVPHAPQPRQGRPKIAQGAAGTPQADPQALGNRSHVSASVESSSHHHTGARPRPKPPRSLLRVPSRTSDATCGVMWPRRTAGLLVAFGLGRPCSAHAHPGLRPCSLCSHGLALGYYLWPATRAAETHHVFGSLLSGLAAPFSASNFSCHLAVSSGLLKAV
jgi:hypothetical protein